MPTKVVFFMASLMSEPLIEPAVLNASRNSPAASYPRAPFESGAAPYLVVYAETKAWTLGLRSFLEKPVEKTKPSTAAPPILTRSGESSPSPPPAGTFSPIPRACFSWRAVACLLYTSDAADDLLCVDLGGRRII